jgi:4-hydroxybenzoate polyprenyltransferase
MNEGLQAFFAVGYGAIVVESVVNIIRNIERKNRDWRYWAALGLSIFIAVSMAIFYDIDLLKIAGLEGRWEWVAYFGAVLTGLIMSRGANVVNDIIDRLNAWRIKP